VDTDDARIEALTARLALLERRTADEAAAIRAALHELQGDEPAEPIFRPVPVAAAPVKVPAPRPARIPALTETRALALAGGVVTLFGIILVFVLAADRGWIGPSVRCLIGAGVSTLLVVTALMIRRRVGVAASGLAAAGAGVGGFYVTLYAASRGYHLLGNGSAWAAVVVISGLAVSMALAWRSELLAVLGLGAVVVAPVAVEGRLTGIGLGASVCAAAAALGLGQQHHWRLLGGLAYGLALIQVAFYVGDTWDEWQHRSTAAVLAWLVFALALAGAALYQRREDETDNFAAALVSVSLPLALLSVWALFHGTDRGSALLLVAAAYAIAACGYWLDLRLRELAELAVAFALFAIALATASFLSNGGLAAAWILEGVMLIALAVRLGRRRYQAAGLAYLSVAAAHLLLFETPFRHLFTERAHPAENIGGLVFLVAALAAAALLLRGRELLQPRLDLGLAAAAALAGLYALSLGVMEAAQWLGAADVHAKFQRGETLVSALWAVVALGLLVAGRRSKEIRSGAFVLLGLALAKLFLFDLSRLSSLSRAGSFLAVGLALLAGGFLVQRFTSATRRPS
jgi:uncharacterized membrane protein